jgi:nucleoid-associated protein EbfC
MKIDKSILEKAQKMQQEMANIQEKMASMTEVGESGGGLVKATVRVSNGHLMSIEINKSALSDCSMLQDLICAAINNALQKVEKTRNEQMSAITGGMDFGF